MIDSENLGLDDWERGKNIALACSYFKEDVEEELVADELVSCYNCRYRRWNANGIQCMRVK